MAKVKSNPTTGDMSGRIGDLVFVRHKPGEMIVRKRPVRKAPKTPREAANQDGFSLAVIYAKAVWSTRPDLKERYNAVARLQGRQGFHLAKADFRRPPKVVDIDLSGYTGGVGELIRITAEDDFEVKEVNLVIRNMAGAVLEQGAATNENRAWNYRATIQIAAGQTVAIEATALDHPNHTDSKRVDHACGMKR